MPWCMIFEDDVVSVGKCLEELGERLLEWKEALDSEMTEDQ